MVKKSKQKRKRDLSDLDDSDEISSQHSDQSIEFSLRSPSHNDNDNEDNSDEDNSNNNNDNENNYDDSAIPSSSSSSVGPLLQLHSFSSLNPPLANFLVDAIEKKFGFTTCTPVQSAVIPLFTNHKDVVVEACTGSGKTLAYLIPILQIIHQSKIQFTKHQALAMIIVPTRELANQIFDVLKTLLSYDEGKKIHVFSIQPFVLVGGTNLSYDRQRFEDSGGNIIVGTPGRIEEILCLQNQVLNLSSFEVLVLDEADRLLDMGFEKSLNAILGRLPKQRRTGLFSATQTDELKKIIRAGMRNPVKVKVNVQPNQTLSNEIKIPMTLGNYFVVCEANEKISQLCHFLEKNSDLKIMVYFLTCACVDYFGKVFTQLKMFKNNSILSLHGKMVQKKRTLVYEKFLKQEKGVLLCTDVAARGLDIPDIDFIVQFDPPQDPNAFVHRVGRTARMGKSGRALLYLVEEETSYVEFLKIRKVPIEEKALFEDCQDLTEEIRELNKKDRDFFEKGLMAYVSFIRAYKEHHCQYIFQLHKLNFGKIATGFGLLCVPKMPELRNKTIEFKVEDIDLKSIPYLDKVREQQRLIRLKKQEEEWQNTAKEREDWKKKRKREIDKLEKQTDKRQKQRRKTHSAVKEWEELAFDHRMSKQLKKGKISQSQFDKILGEDVEELDKTGGNGNINKKQNNNQKYDAKAQEGQSKKLKTGWKPKVVLPARQVVLRRKLAKLKEARQRKGQK